MKSKKTFSNWLATRFQLIIRNEENFAEKTSIGFTYSKIILFSFILFALLFVFSLFMVKTVLSRWFDPKYAQMMMNQELYELKLKVDSLDVEIDQKDRYIASFQRIMSGDTGTVVDPEQIIKTQGDQPISSKAPDLKIKQEDSVFRREFERSDLSLITLTSAKYRELQETFFFSPITGFISDHYDVKTGHFGVDIVAKTNESVKCIADGTVIFSSWTQDSGYVIMVQHRGNMISSYKHNAQLLKKVGTFVNAGEIISIVGNSGEMTNGPHLHFELWYNGNSLNPEEFVTF